MRAPDNWPRMTIFTTCKILSVFVCLFVCLFVVCCLFVCLFVTDFESWSFVLQPYFAHLFDTGFSDIPWLRRMEYRVSCQLRWTFMRQVYACAIALPMLTCLYQNPTGSCAATEYCCPDAKHCLTPTNVSCAQDATVGVRCLQIYPTLLLSPC